MKRVLETRSDQLDAIGTCVLCIGENKTVVNAVHGNA